VRVQLLGGPGTDRIGLLSFSQLMTTRNRYGVPGTRRRTRYLYRPSWSVWVVAGTLTTSVHFRSSVVISTSYDETATPRDRVPASAAYENQLTVIADVVTMTTRTASLVTGSTETQIHARDGRRTCGCHGNVDTPNTRQPPGSIIIIMPTLFSPPQ